MGKARERLRTRRMRTAGGSRTAAGHPSKTSSATCGQRARAKVPRRESSQPSVTPAARGMISSIPKERAKATTDNVRRKEATKSPATMPTAKPKSDANLLTGADIEESLRARILARADSGTANRSQGGPGVRSARRSEIDREAQRCESRRHGCKFRARAGVSDRIFYRIEIASADCRDGVGRTPWNADAAAYAFLAGDDSGSGDLQHRRRCGIDRG